MESPSSPSVEFLAVGWTCFLSRWRRSGGRMPSFRRTKTARSRAGCWVQISEKFKMKVENTTKIPNLQPGRKAGPSSGANFSLRKNRAVSKSRKKRAPHARVRSWQVRPQGWPLPFARKRRVRLLADYFSNFEAKFYKFSTNVLRFVLRNAFAISLSLKKSLKR